MSRRLALIPRIWLAKAKEKCNVEMHLPAVQASFPAQEASQPNNFFQPRQWRLYLIDFFPLRVHLPFCFCFESALDPIPCRRLTVIACHLCMSLRSRPVSDHQRELYLTDVVLGNFSRKWTYISTAHLHTLIPYLPHHSGQRSDWG